MTTKLEELNKIMMDAKLKNLETEIEKRAKNGQRDYKFFINDDDYIREKLFAPLKLIGPSKIMFDFLKEQGYDPKIISFAGGIHQIVVNWV